MSDMIPIAKKAFAFSEVETDDMLKVIWGVCVLINLSYLFVSGLNVYFQCFYFFSILILGTILLWLHPTKNTFQRLILGVLILNIWFIQNVSYRSMGELPFLLVVFLSVLEMLIGISLSFYPNMFLFLSEIVLALTPLNLIHNLPPSIPTIYVLFFIMNWYLKEAYFILRHKPCEENLISRIGILIPLFNLPFVPMCVYYLVISSWAGYSLYLGEIQKPNTDPVSPPEEAKIEVLLVKPEEEVEETKPPLPQPPKVQKMKPPKFRPAQIIFSPPQPIISPEPLSAPVKKENKNLGENLKKLYS